jgi:xanthine dehydrogenase YagS FAD-binding subunit
MNRFEWTSSATVEEALAQLEGGAVVKAGGVDLLDLMKEGIVQPKRVASIGAIPGLDAVSLDAQGLELGPLATLATVAESDDIRKHWPALAGAAAAAATPQIRNTATVGGNLLQRPRCWYFRSHDFHCLKKGGTECFAQNGENQFHAVFDNEICAIVHPSALAVPLVAYGAELEIMGREGRRRVPIGSFFVHPSTDVARENSLGSQELLLAIRVAMPPAGTRSAYVKQGEKESFDWPLAEAAVAVESNGAKIRKASIVLGAAAAVPMHAAKAETYLAGKTLDESTAREAGRQAMEGATPFEQNAYKIPLFRAIVARALLAAR